MVLIHAPTYTQAAHAVGTNTSLSNLLSVMLAACYDEAMAAAVLQGHAPIKHGAAADWSTADWSTMYTAFSVCSHACGRRQHGACEADSTCRYKFLGQRCGQQKKSKLPRARQHPLQC